MRPVTSKQDVRQLWNWLNEWAYQARSLNGRESLCLAVASARELQQRLQ